MVRREQGGPNIASVIYSEWFDTELGDDIKAPGRTSEIGFPEEYRYYNKTWLGTALLYSNINI